mmetsp:Transcript_89156/g.251012  ORF Transcript_89156/g.251012 Transcript_89156/m.251012 type:complete len:248 (+) Transcript_89156:3644-4387(+)
MVGVHGPIRAPRARLLGPLVQEAHRQDHERVRSTRPLCPIEEGAELNGLPKAHLVSQNAAMTTSPDIHKPRDAFVLIVVQALVHVAGNCERGLSFTKVQLDEARRARLAPSWQLRDPILLHVCNVGLLLDIVCLVRRRRLRRRLRIWDVFCPLAILVGAVPCDGCTRRNGAGSWRRVACFGWPRTLRSVANVGTRINPRKIFTLFIVEAAAAFATVHSTRRRGHLQAPQSRQVLVLLLDLRFYPLGS